MGRARRLLLDQQVLPDRETNERLAIFGFEIQSPTTVAKLLQRSEFDLDRFVDSSTDWDAMKDLVDSLCEIGGEEREGVANQARYAGYIERQTREAERLREDETMTIPQEFSYDRPGLSREAIEKLSYVRPRSLGQAARVPGVTPAAVSILRMHLRQGTRVAGRADRAL